jgi:hypothetical protein
MHTKKVLGGLVILKTSLIKIELYFLVPVHLYDTIIFLF